MILISTTRRTTTNKPVRSIKCPKCENQKICEIPSFSSASNYRLDRQRYSENRDSIILKCSKCNSRIELTIE